MNPEHHEERLRTWAVTTRRPILSLDYGKAPECKSSLSAVLRRGILTVHLSQIPTRLLVMKLLIPIDS